jgi:amidase
MANSSEGVARLLQAIAGTDPYDPRQRGVIPIGYDLDFLSRLDAGVRGKKIAIVREGFAQDGKDVGFPPADPEVDRHVRDAIRAYEQLGAMVEEISVPLHLDAYYIWSLIITFGSAEFMIKGSGLGTNWQGFYNSSLGEAVARAVKARPNDLPEALQQYDILAMPTTPFTATKQVERGASLTEYIVPTLDMLRNTCVADITGHPSISIPCGMLNGLPVGMMLTGRHLEDNLLVQAAAAFETLGDWRKM